MFINEFYLTEFITRLRELILTGNIGIEIKGNMENLRELQTVKLSQCSLLRFPNNLWNLPVIEEIWLNENKIEKVNLPNKPKPSLKILNVRNNGIRFFFSEMERSKKIFF